MIDMVCEVEGKRGCDDFFPLFFLCRIAPSEVYSITCI